MVDRLLLKAMVDAKVGSASPENASPARTDDEKGRRRRKHISGGRGLMASVNALRSRRGDRSTLERLRAGA